MAEPMPADNQFLNFPWGPIQMECEAHDLVVEGVAGVEPCDQETGEEVTRDNKNKGGVTVVPVSRAPLESVQVLATCHSLVMLDTDGLVGLGLASSGDHSPEEKADIASMKRQAKRAAILMSRLAGEKGRK